MTVHALSQPYGRVAATVAGVVLLAALALAVPADWLGWIRAERWTAVRHLETTLWRVGWALVAAWAAALPIAVAMRRSVAVETALTGWLLSAVAIPWVVAAIALNMMFYVQLKEWMLVALAAGPAALWILAALGRHMQAEGRRTALVRRGMRVLLGILAVSEILSRANGLGAELRFYVIYWSPAHLLLYVLLALALVAALEVMAGPLARLALRIARPRSPRPGAA